MTKTILAWYFAPIDNRLRYGDGRQIVIGETHTVEGYPVACKYGLHGSRRLIDALKYAPGPMLYRVELGGLTDKEDDKIAAQSRRYLAGFDATDLLRDFARRCALDVIHLWDAPDVVVQYLKTGDESIRSVSGYASASWAASWGAFWAAARSASAAAYASAPAAAYASAAWDAYASAAWDAAEDKQNRRLTAMVSARMGRCEPL